MQTKLSLKQCRCTTHSWWPGPCGETTLMDSSSRKGNKNREVGGGGSVDLSHWPRCWKYFQLRRFRTASPDCLKIITLHFFFLRFNHVYEAIGTCSWAYLPLFAIFTRVDIKTRPSAGSTWRGLFGWWRMMTKRFVLTLHFSVYCCCCCCCCCCW